MEFLISLLLIGFVGFIILTNTGALRNVGNRRDPARLAMRDEQRLNQEFFNGDQTVTFKTPGNYLPPSVVITAAPEHGYRLVSRDADGPRETLVFERA